MKDFEGIHFLEGATDFEECTGGYSSAKKYFFTKDGKRYFIKIKDSKIRSDIEEFLTSYSIPHAKVIEVGQNLDGFSFIIEEFVEGKDLFDQFFVKSTKGIYEYGFKLGEKYSNFRKDFKDKKVDKKALEIFNEKHERVEREFDERCKGLDKLTSKSKKTFLDLKDYFENNLSDIKNSLMCFGCTDIKPKNFMITNENKLVAVDFEQIKHFEFSTALRWGLVSGDADLIEKYLSFSSGYMEGYFQFNVPERVLSAINCMFAMMAFREIKKYIEKDNFEKAEKYIEIIEKYVKNGQVDITERLINFKPNVCRLIKGAKFEVVDGSYDDHNLVFKCTKGNKKYFLKIMEGSEEKLGLRLKKYNILAKSKIPTPKIYCSGKASCEKMFVLFEFIDGKEWDKFFDENDFESGVKCGIKVAEAFKPIWELKDESLYHIVTIEDIMKKNYENIEIAYSSDIKNQIPCDKKEIIKLLNKFKKHFKDEPMHLTHADLKFANVLSKTGEDFYIADNESYCIGYEIVNFRYNISDKFFSNTTPINKGFLKGYLQCVYGEKLPKRLDGQIKFVMLCCFLNHAKRMAIKKSDVKKIKFYKELFDNGFYEKDIDWSFEVEK